MTTSRSRGRTSAPVGADSDRGRNDRHAGIRAPAVISGRQGFQRLTAPISTAQRTVVTPEFADRVAGVLLPQRACTESALGRFCGPEVVVEAALLGFGCGSVTTLAIVSPLPRSIGPAIIGTDVLERAGPQLSFGPRKPMGVTCERPRKKVGR